MKKKLIVSLFAICIATLVFSQKADKDQGLLWRISGNGLTKPSYLFGTMHVNKKMVFHLGEPWFNAIDSVDIVAMEIQPELWLKDMVESNKYASFGGDNDSYDDYEGEDNSIYEIGKNRLGYIGSALNDDPSIINSVMYRMNSYESENQEDSWLDLYIFQIGKKLGKQATGLESYEESTISMHKSRIPDDESEKKRSTKYFERSTLETAYRNGNLDLIDSISENTSTRNSNKYLLHERNERFVQRMDSIMKTKGLFAGVGAAHLPGDMGMISLLRKMGYTVTAVPMGERDANKRKALDETIIPVSFTKQTSFDKTLSYSAPTTIMPYYRDGGVSVDIGAELINNAYFSVARVKTFTGLLREDLKDTWHLIDSIIYDEVPGKIQDQQKIEIDGYKGYDIKTRTRKGHTIFLRMLQLPEEVIVMKVSAPDEKVIDSLGLPFIKSLNITPTTHSDEWVTYSLPDSTLTVALPHTPLYYGPNLKEYEEIPNVLTAIDKKTNTQFLVMRRPVYVHLSIADTFKLSMEAKDFLEATKLEEDKRTFIKHNGYNALKVTYKTKDGIHTEALYLLQNSNVCVALAYYKKNTSSIAKFFNSVAFALPTYTTFYPVVDSIIQVAVQLPYQNTLENGWYNNYSSSYLKTDTNKLISRKRIFRNKAETESVTVEYFRNSRYYKYESEEQRIKIAKLMVSAFNDFSLTDEKVTKLKDSTLQVDFVMSDTGTSRKIRGRILLNKQTKYVLLSSFDPLLGQSKFVRNFFDTFSPLDSLHGSSAYIDKSDLLFEDIKGTDSVKRKFALAQIWDTELNARHVQDLVSMINNMPDGAKDPVKLKAYLYRKLGKVGNDSIIPFMKAQYIAAGDTSDYQIAILRGLSLVKTKAAMQAYKELLLTETPFNSSSNTSGLIFGLLGDSMELAKDIFPDVYELLSIDDYRSSVYSLMADMLDSNVITPTFYKDKLNVITFQAKIALKKLLSNLKEKTYGSEVSELYTLHRLLLPYYDQPNVKAHFERVFSANNQKLKLSLFPLFFKYNYSIDTAVINSLAADDEYRNRLYAALDTVGKAKMFPKEWKSKELVAKSMLFDDFSSSIKHKDSVQLIEVRKMYWEGKKGDVYFYKFKPQYGDDYKIAVVGIVADDYSVYENVFTDRKTTVLKEDEDLKKQLNDLLYSNIKASMVHVYRYEYKDIVKDDEEYNNRYYSSYYNR